MAYLAPSVGASHKALLADLMPGDSGIKYCLGEVIWERKAFTFVSETAPSGLVKRLQLGLLEIAKSKLRVRGRKPSGEGEEVEGDEDFDDAELAAAADTAKPTPAVAGGDGAVAKIAALANRHAKVKGPLAALVAKGGGRPSWSAVCSTSSRRTSKTRSSTTQRRSSKHSKPPPHACRRSSSPWPNRWWPKAPAHGLPRRRSSRPRRRARG